MVDSEIILQRLRCPVTHQPLKRAPRIILDDLESRRKDGILLKRSGQEVVTPIVDGLITQDQRIFYNTDDGIPQLLAPEGISLNPDIGSLDISKAQYWEPYEEMTSYDGISSAHLESGEADSALGEITSENMKTLDAERQTFPDPAGLWLDAKGCVLAQEKAYRYLTPINEKRVLQIGGHGSHLIKFLLAGAKEAWLLSPMLGELQRARYLSRKFGVEDRLFTIQGIAEEIPFKNECLDRIYSGGCLHHTQIDMVAPEIQRVLQTGGRASFVDPVLTLPYRMFVRPFYSRGIGRVDQAHCTPINRNALGQFLSRFAEGRIETSRTFVHLPLIMATRYLKADLRIETIQFIEKMDQGVARLLPFLQKRFSPVAAICVQK